ncbi:hypothetical protein PACID_10130 [Acidipropionibacterium acidipropionici ATCC 4875]|uniref:Lipoprotein n=2 Tax=Acidipropionibacterium acidipropionici TaxID=1748 RepID=K7RV74_ACIA4|nr:hypothetical protein [Acidipropionibacterium acidipropionici]AFV88843.1 hypothetical protein PACID_10130 [Acidipropionibacterium acidipropionici ATCC 4875]
MTSSTRNGGSRLRRLAVVVAGLTLLAGCRGATTPAPPEPSRASMTPSSTISASASLLSGRTARSIVDELVTASGNSPVTKVDITSRAVSISVRAGSSPQIWTWQGGRITTSSPQSAQTVSRPFDPDSFAIDHLDRILSVAARATGSSKNQELQILEYNQGVVLMSVSTRPETRPVFFRADGSLVTTVDFTTVAGMTEALRDAVGEDTQVLSVAYQPGKGLMVDTRTGTDGIVLRRTRSADMPAWAVERRGDTGAALFSPSDISPAVLADLMTRVPTVLSKPAEASKLSFTIDMSDRRSLPTIHFTLAGSTMVTDLEGKDITAQVR